MFSAGDPETAAGFRSYVFAFEKNEENTLPKNAEDFTTQRSEGLFITMKEALSAARTQRFKEGVQKSFLFRIAASYERRETEHTSAGLLILLKDFSFEPSPLKVNYFFLYSL